MSPNPTNRSKAIRYRASISRQFPLHPKEIVRAGFNKIASAYGAARTGDSEDVKLLHLLVERLPEGAMVFDGGCGSGHPVTQFLADFFQVTGVDFSEKQVRLAKERVSEADFICADITSLPFRDGVFDAVCSYYAIIHVPRSEHQKLLLNFSKILRPGGLALLCMGAGDLPNDIGDWYGVQMFWSHYDSEANLTMMKENGFDINWFKIIKDPIDPASRDRKSTRLNSSHSRASRMPSSA